MGLKLYKEASMRFGVTLPSMGPLAQPQNLIDAAKAAEQLGSVVVTRTPLRVVHEPVRCSE